MYWKIALTFETVRGPASNSPSSNRVESFFNIIRIKKNDHKHKKFWLLEKLSMSVPKKGTIEEEMLTLMLGWKGSLKWHLGNHSFLVFRLPSFFISDNFSTHTHTITYCFAHKERNVRTVKNVVLVPKIISNPLS